MTEDKTKEIVAAMLKENTGRHFLDSGGAYGRHWERNQGREFENEPDQTIEFRVYQREGKGELEIDATLNLYHFLVKNLVYQPDIDRWFHKFADKFPDLQWWEIMKLFCKQERLKGRFEPKGSGYTYNEENLLSQDFQYVWVEDTKTDENLFFLQIHGGCDARGGFTAPRVFSGDFDYFFDYQRFYFGCHHCDFRLDCDDGYHWRTEDGSKDFEPVKAIDLDTEEYPEEMTALPEFSAWNEMKRLISQGEKQVAICEKEFPHLYPKWKGIHEEKKKELEKQMEKLLEEMVRELWDIGICVVRNRNLMCPECGEEIK